MSCMTSGRNINTPISKFKFFKKCITEEVEEDDSNFLRIGDITEDYLTGNKPEPADDNWSCSRAKRHMIRAAIWNFYNVFDCNMYKSCKNPKGYLTKIIWAKFRSLHRKWELPHSLIQENIKKIKEARLAIIRANARTKRQQKEKQQMLTLGGGDIEKGRKKFIERMHIQKENKLNKEHDVSLELEQEFTKWLSTDEAKLYTAPMKCFAPKQFRICETYGHYQSVSAINLKVNNVSGLIDALRQLANHPAADTLTVEGVFGWDEKIPFSTPCTHTFPEGGEVLVLNNYGRIIQGDRIRIIGYVNVSGKSYIVSSNTSNAYRLFPKQFEKLEYRNKKIPGQMHILYNIDNSITRIKVTRVHQGFKYLMNINILYNGNNTINALQIFENHVIRDLKNESNTAILRKQKEKDQRIKEARRKGLETQKKSLKYLGLNDDGKYNHVDDAIHRGHVNTRDHKVQFEIPDTTDQIIKLCDMFEKGLLNNQQFELAKNKLLR